jgi:membrane protease YdiL (CAAX protease family)
MISAKANKKSNFIGKHSRLLFRSIFIVGIYIVVSALIVFILFERTGFYDATVPWRYAIAQICHVIIGLTLIACLFKRECERAILSIVKAYRFSKKNILVELKNIGVVTFTAVLAKFVAILTTVPLLKALNLKADLVSTSQQTEFEVLLDYENSNVIILAASYALTILVTVFVIPCGEEFVFRGVLLKQDNAITHFKLLTVASALLFAIVHFDPIWTLEYFTIGCVFAYYIFKKRASIITTTISHSILNALSIVVTIV